ncbi:type III restriction endonuclease subunit R [Methanosarcina mazei]|nr:type III restriction endonuclease subunit R [Methanosarcina mazei]
MLFGNTEFGDFSKFADENTIKVVDIHKLTDEKKGSGVTIDIEKFGTKNLVFVDEGHKGSSGKKWNYFRNELTSDGFKIEYSATFGQAVASGSEEGQKLFHEYGKSILFDYSYRFFFEDGYGKKYKILNLKDKAYSDEIKHKLMLVNLLSFYQQKKIFNDNYAETQEYNIAEPLWVFLGSSVNKNTETSDVLQVINFLGKFLKNEDNWVINNIKDIFEGNSGLEDPTGIDIFSPQYPEQKLKFLRESGLSPEEIYTNILKKVFHTVGSAPLYLVNIKNAKGEIALKCGTGKYFGVINIGSDGQFLDRVENECKDPTTAKILNLRIDSDDISYSLFRDINSNNSNINILIGAKKFIEGWNSWRVSNMGLLNIGKSEGSQIIQLFGRGVRLKGKNMSLKRSTATDGSSEYIPVLETLNIFGIEANYMDQFKYYLRNEGVTVDNRIEIPIKIQINDSYIKEELLIPDYNNREFKNHIFELDSYEKMEPVEIDLYPKIDVLESNESEEIRAEYKKPRREIRSPEINLLDWTKIYYQLLEFRLQKDWNNIYFSEETLRGVIERGNNAYSLKCPENIIHPLKFEGVCELEEAVIIILKKYLQKYYNRQKNIWINRNLYLKKLDEENGNFSFEEFRVSIGEKELEIIVALQELETLKEDFMRGNTDNVYLTNVYFDRHIYQPLIAKKLRDSSKYSIHPNGLNSGEVQFIEDLKTYLDSNPEVFKDTKLFVLRNLPKLGVKFFDTVSFFPDFIIWLKNGDNSQHLLFVDPKGLIHTNGFNDEKIKLCHSIKDTEAEINTKLQKQGSTQQVKLDSFIVSVTSKRELEPVFRVKLDSKYEMNHILFQEDRNYIEQMFDSIF